MSNHEAFISKGFVADAKTIRAAGKFKPNGPTYREERLARKGMARRRRTAGTAVAAGGGGYLGSKVAKSDDGIIHVTGTEKVKTSRETRGTGGLVPLATGKRKLNGTPTTGTDASLSDKINEDAKCGVSGRSSKVGSTKIREQVGKALGGHGGFLEDEDLEDIAKATYRPKNKSTADAYARGVSRGATGGYIGGAAVGAGAGGAVGARSGAGVPGALIGGGRGAIGGLAGGAFHGARKQVKMGNAVKLTGEKSKAHRSAELKSGHFQTASRGRYETLGKALVPRQVTREALKGMPTPGAGKRISTVFNKPVGPGGKHAAPKLGAVGKSHGAFDGEVSKGYLGDLTGAMKGAGAVMRGGGGARRAAGGVSMRGASGGARKAPGALKSFAGANKKPLAVGGGLGLGAGAAMPRKNKNQF